MILANSTGAAQGGGGGTMLFMLLPLVAIAAWMWWSGRKRQRASDEMTSSVEVGRDVVLRNGTVVTVVAQDDDYITVEVSPGVTQRWVPGAVSRVLPLPGVDVGADDTLDTPRSDSDNDESQDK